MQIKIKYTERHSEDGYEYKKFNTYGEFGEWFINNRERINLWDVNVKSH